MATPPLDATACPLCGKPNRCAMEVERESGVKQPPCWCLGVDFSAELLARVPAEKQRMACICSACAAASADSFPASDSPPSS
ncbi:cysteine-rich CWC family protein [Ramlibacter sp.]|uniref:cysteine-rich CWC family protein n=1 Tax=Ramlibacter sp. TaxID=1917967 RepID=UPI003D0B7091